MALRKFQRTEIIPIPMFNLVGIFAFLFIKLE